MRRPSQSTPSFAVDELCGPQQDLSLSEPASLELKWEFRTQQAGWEGEVSEQTEARVQGHVHVCACHHVWSRVLVSMRAHVCMCVCVCECVGGSRTHGWGVWNCLQEESHPRFRGDR